MSQRMQYPQHNGNGKVAAQVAAPPSPVGMRRAGRICQASSLPGPACSPGQAPAAAAAAAGAGGGQSDQRVT
jgi:hypothetical protein